VDFEKLPSAMSMTNRSAAMTADEVLGRYAREDLPEFVEMRITSIEEIGRFGDRPLHVACIRGLMEEIAALVAAGADVNAPGENGNTPLHEAVGQASEPVVKYLLQHGAAHSQKNDDGQSSIDLARLMGRSELAMLLGRPSKQ
jgi:ankyrin repeat protein